MALSRLSFDLTQAPSHSADQPEAPITVDSIMSEVITALMQGCGDVPVTAEARALMYEAYALRASDRLTDWPAIREAVLLNGVEMGRTAANFARQRGHQQVLQSDLQRAMVISRSGGNPDKPCPFCRPDKSN